MLLAEAVHPLAGELTLVLATILLATLHHRYANAETLGMPLPAPFEAEPTSKRLANIACFIADGN